MNADDQAFPVPGLSNLPNGEFIHPGAGLAVRAYFAAMAMQGAVNGGGFERYSMPEKDIAARAVRCADALIAELNKERP